MSANVIGTQRNSQTGVTWGADAAAKAKTLRSPCGQTRNTVQDTSRAVRDIASNLVDTSSTSNIPSPCAAVTSVQRTERTTTPDTTLVSSDSATATSNSTLVSADSSLSDISVSDISFSLSDISVSTEPALTPVKSASETPTSATTLPVQYGTTIGPLQRPCTPLAPSLVCASVTTHTSSVSATETPGPATGTTSSPEITTTAQSCSLPCAPTSPARSDTETHIPFVSDVPAEASAASAQNDSDDDNLGCDVIATVSDVIAAVSDAIATVSDHATDAPESGAEDSPRDDADAASDTDDTEFVLCKEEMLDDEVQPGTPLVAFMCKDLLSDDPLAGDEHEAQDEDGADHTCVWCGEQFETAAAVEEHSLRHAEPDVDEQLEAESTTQSLAGRTKSATISKSVPGTVPGLRQVLAHVKGEGLRVVTVIDMGRPDSPPPERAEQTIPETYQCDPSVRAAIGMGLGQRFACLPGEELQCSECPTSFETREELARHRLTRHAVETWHRCKEPGCPDAFNSELRLRAHVAKAHGALKYSCERCPARLPNALLLAAHRAEVHGLQQSVSCPVCPTGEGAVQLDSPALLTAHLRAKHPGSAPLRCATCGLFSSNLSAMLQHHQEHVDEMRRLHCPVCMVWFPARDLLLAHVRFAHAQGSQYVCPGCNCGAPSAEVLASHVKKMHRGATPYGCAGCRKRFPSLAALREHALQTLHHIAPTGRRGIFTCKGCRLVFREPLRVAEHHDSVHMNLLPLDRISQLVSLMQDSRVVEKAMNKAAEAARPAESPSSSPTSDW